MADDRDEMMSSGSLSDPDAGQDPDTAQETNPDNTSDLAPSPSHGEELMDDDDSLVDDEGPVDDDQASGEEGTTP